MGKNSKKYLSEEENLEMIRQAQEGSEEAMHILMEAHEDMVWNCVHSFKGRGQEMEDLFQWGCYRLIQCIRSYDLSRAKEVKFYSYAMPSVKFEINRRVREGTTIRTPRPVLDYAYHITKHELADKSPEEIINFLNLTEDRLPIIEETLLYMKVGNKSPVSLEHVVHDGGEGGRSALTLEDMLAGDVNGDYWEDKIALRETVSRLENPYRQIIEMLYFEDLPQREVTRRLGVSQAHVSRLKDRALVKLKSLLKEEVNDMAKPLHDSETRKKQKKEVLKLLREGGLTQREISRRTGMSEASVWYYAQKVKKEKDTRENAPRGKKAVKEEEKGANKVEKGTLHKKEIQPVLEVPIMKVNSVVDHAPERVLVNPETVHKEQFSFNLQHAGTFKKEKIIRKLLNTVNILEELDVEELNLVVSVGK